MNQPIDHAVEAKFLIDCAFGAKSRSDDPVVNATSAVAHATLALAEQQRAANLIALASLHPSWSLGNFRTELLREAGRLVGKEFPR